MPSALEETFLDINPVFHESLWVYSAADQNAALNLHRQVFGNDCGPYHRVGDRVCIQAAYTEYEDLVPSIMGTISRIIGRDSLVVRTVEGGESVYESDNRARTLWVTPRLPHYSHTITVLGNPIIPNRIVALGYSRWERLR